jgi:hypothetical protein
VRECHCWASRPQVSHVKQVEMPAQSTQIDLPSGSLPTSRRSAVQLAQCPRSFTALVTHDRQT